MSKLHTLRLSHLPEHDVHVALFTGVTNAAVLRSQLLAGNAEFEYAFIDASTIVSTSHALAAVHQAVHSLLVAQKLRTHNVHSETVFSLSPSNNIADAFRRFGVSATTTSLLAIKVSTPAKPFSAESVTAHLQSVVEGQPVEFSDAVLGRELVDWGKVAKYYKVKPGGASGKGEVTLAARREAEVQVLGKMVMRAVG